MIKKLIIQYCLCNKTYNGICDSLDSWIVTKKGSFEEFKQFVKESVDFYFEPSKEEYTLEFVKFENDYTSYG